MRNLKLAATGAAAIAALAVAAPANATIFEYGMTDGSVLTINTDTSTGTWVGSDINAVFTSDDFATFTGGANPTFSSILTSLDGTRLINGQLVTDNPKNIDTTHPQKLIGWGDRFNLWAWWGDPIIGGDYVRSIDSYSATEVPAPGMFGLFAMALALLGFGRFRRGGAARRPKAVKQAGLVPAAA
ncbi:hypothetical protein ACFCW2_03470 [Qipengyuania sp. DSG2-2]|uniref:hypothetical protein n=1 Tax=Qipengyuania sp. DGS2-2 TaxID=3349631 RepID=UPI0036D3731D